MDEALLGRVQKQAWFHKYPRGWPFLLFLIASLGTAVSVIAIERADRQTREIELDRNLTEIASALQRRVTENIALLRAGSALFAMQDGVSGRQFAEFAADLQANGNLYGSLGMGWAPLLAASRVPSFEVWMRDNGEENYYIRPAPSDQRFATPVVYLEPLSRRNREAIGYDMYSESVRRRAMNLAIQLGKPVATGKLHLIQDEPDAGEAGFIIYMPVINNRGGRRIVKGFVYSPFRASDFLDSAAELYRNDDIEVEVFDEDDNPDNLLVERRVEGVSGTTMERRIDVGNHGWVIRVSDKKAGVLSTLSRITLFFGAVASLMVMAIGRLITRRAAEDRRVLEWLTSEASIRNSLTRELNHRVKNTLANVLSIAALTRRRATDIDDFTESLTARIRALSATHDLLSQSNWTDAPLGDVVRSELAPYMEGSEAHVVLAGPEIKLAPNDAMSLGLAIHELATNAAKYGALSTAEGRIHVTWKLLRSGLAQIDWREEGGPPVVEPTKRGFGRDLIEKIVAHELRSQVDLRFLPGGVECRLQVPVRALRAAFALRGERRA
ncbi:CHASE domain-containing protein [Novosphingobium album (ex Liu et al. 2023)]|uniref:histidine kinase n=1 Tax=Novosphingobium album (ex Liu et al. 2023) TaxID=3031130 RepID=A0ABT5WMS6_9SPHN|nr:CHASE domain-containing protein [Novosphingobium album (ex Liu et al. 2023)]MDE8651335.1 CHASE domain-containing protein [Novosphingobium album (ex Liu et al. 2023)]